MKNLSFIAIIAVILLQSCAKPLTLPSDLHKSVLLIEKLPTDSVKINEKGKKEVVDRKIGGWASMLNRRNNNKVQKVFATYPFEYKIITEDEVGDNIDPNKTTYYLKNGSSSTSTTLRTNSSGALRTSRSTKTKVVLENLTKKRKSTLGEVPNGVAGLSGKIVKSAIKMKKSKKKK